MKMFYPFLLLLFIEGCTIPFFNSQEPLTTEDKYVNYVLYEIESIVDYMKDHREEDVVFDLLIVTTKDEYYEVFGMLTLETDTEVKMFFMYNMDYLFSIMRIMSYELGENNYDWSWHMVLLDIKRQLQEDKNKQDSKPIEEH